MNGAYWGPITLQSTSLTDFGPAARTGKRRIYEHPTYGRQEYVLAFNTVTAILPDGCVAKLVISQTTTNASQPANVTVNAASTTPGYCVNNSGADIAVSSYFWGLQKGDGYGLGGTVGDGVQFTGGAAGIITAVADGLDAVHGIAVSDVTTALTNRVTWILPSHGVFDLA